MTQRLTRSEVRRWMEYGYPEDERIGRALLAAWDALERMESQGRHVAETHGDGTGDWRHLLMRCDEARAALPAPEAIETEEK